MKSGKESVSTRAGSLFFLLAIVFSIGITSCNKASQDTSPGFDRQAFLTNYADNLIIPAFSNLTGKTQVLKEKANSFAESPTTQSLEETRAAWKEAYLAWQHCTGFCFGPAELPLSGNLRESLGTFPVSAAGIEEEIANGPSEGVPSLRDRKGFLAAEYLLFRGAPNATLDSFLRTTGSQARRDFLLRLTNDIHSLSVQARNAWTAGKTDFINNNGTDAGSSTSALLNGFVADFETIKNYKLGLPLGLRPGQEEPEPERVEAFYSGYSAQFIKEHIRAVELCWNGNSVSGLQGIGFDDYLQTVVGGPELIQSSTRQYNKVLQAASALPEDPLSMQILETPEKPKALHMELQKQTRYFKSELSSLLGIAITYQSGDGD